MITVMTVSVFNEKKLIWVHFIKTTPDHFGGIKLANDPLNLSNLLMENNSDFLVVPEYVHWSMLDFNVDMRGEIAMLSRNIKIRGEMQNGCPSSNRNCAKWKFDTFGGHVKVSLLHLLSFVFR